MTTYAIIYSGIYGIINLTNDKIYVGSAVNLKLRRHTHFMRMRGNKHPSNHLQASVNKNGIENFKFLFLEICDKSELLIKEKEWINLLDSCNKEKGYNKRAIPTSNLGIKASEETKRKIGLAHKGHTRNRGRKLTEEQKTKLSFIMTGKKHTYAPRKRKPIAEETKRKISETLKKTSYFIGGISKEALVKRAITVKNKSRWKCPDRAKCKCGWCKAVRKQDRRMRYVNECK